MGSIEVNPLSYGDKTLDDGVKDPPLSAEDCADNVDVTFRLLNVPNKNQLDVYEGNDCHLTTRKNTDNPTCTEVITTEIDNFPQMDVIIPADNFCVMGSRTTLKLWFLPVDSAWSNEDVLNVYGYHPEFVIDADPPEPVTNVKGGSGESAIEVEWDSSDGDVDRFYLYVDDGASCGMDMDGGASGCFCDSAELVSGQETDLTHVKSVSESSRKADVDGSLIQGQFAAVAVVAVDEATNRSVVSNVACVEKVETRDPFQVYQDSGGTGDPGCNCSAPGTDRGSTRTGWGLGALVALAALAGRTRRRQL